MLSTEASSPFAPVLRIVTTLSGVAMMSSSA
jgi:hypothetical protein